MPYRPRIILTNEELLRAEIPTNHVLVEMKYKSEDLTTHSGIRVGFNSEMTFAADETDPTSHVADVAEVWGIVAKVPDRLIFDTEDPLSMDWETEQKLQENDIVYFRIIESKNANEIQCGNIIYRSIPYSDCIVAKRDIPFNGRWVTISICLNGYVLCEPCYFKKEGDLDFISENRIDKTRGIVKYIGQPPKSYLRPEYSHINDIRINDEVLFEKGAPLFYLERLSETGTFDGGKQYWVVQRRRIAMILNR